ncbi:MAG: TetR/AcrR family transcriptional regulator [Marinibacterium sp.]|nr:TetR/AcrR family transcriptional regulator [Marinibacterium sp.]
MTDAFQPNPAKVAAILSAAIAEFQDNGYAAGSMDRIAQRSGISKRTVYKYFESKENLFCSLIENLADRFAVGLDLRHDPSRPIRGQLEALAWAEGRLLMTPEVIAIARLMLSESHRNPALATKIQGRIDSISAFVRMLQGAHDHGQLVVPDPAMAAEDFLALIKHRAFWPMMFGAPLIGQDDMARIVDNSVEMMMRRYSVA